MKHAFPCGDPALDFVGTLRARRRAQPTEMLTSGVDLDDWFRESALVDDLTPSRPTDLEAALALREAIYSLVKARLDDRPYDADAVELVNDVARTPCLVPQLAGTGRRTVATAEQALSSVARDAIDVLTRPGRPPLKECANPECTQVYVDNSRGRRREWCSMAGCGSRMKSAAYRARKRGTSEKSDAGERLPAPR